MAPARARELKIQCPDGQSKIVPLQGDHITLGRSSTTELCFPEDAGLSRQHMAFEREGDELAGDGLYVGLDPWASHFLALR